MANVGILVVFKYYNFFTDNVNALLSARGITTYSLPLLSLILPIGLSFHTFQAMSYTIEVYRSNQKAERHFGIYALYVMFYPQLVAGPIERPQNVLHQFHEEKHLSYSNIVEGLKLILWGLFKKVVIADRLSLLVNEVYNNPLEYTGLTFVIATVFFAFQIYCDFSGYSSIAIGSARVMGYNLMQNFCMPYLAISIKDFWQRWHISLSTWFRDYVYIPMGGNRVGKWRWYYNVFITFLLSGIWHGANWTYVIWGSLHGFYFIAGSILFSGKSFSYFSKVIPKIMMTLVKRFVIFGLVCFAWIFFRSNSMVDSILIIQNIFDFNQYNLSQFSLHLIPESKNSVYPIDMVLSWFWIVVLIASELLFSRYSFQQLGRPVRWALYLGGMIAILLFGVYDNNQFIYFQF